MKFRNIISAAAALTLLAAGVAFAAMSYECWSYRSGKPDKMVHVSANNNDQAVGLACEKFKKLGIRYDYVKCK
ncbi:MAG: hypothetical protein LBP22_03870 [Deltaproteobacteria bacterium]|nr:hypothetical protein [Deltaproteobacteria bacterium]